MSKVGSREWIDEQRQRGADAAAVPETSAAQPAWWNEESHGEWGEDQAQAVHALETVLGRRVGPNEAAGVNNWANYVRDHGYTAATAQISLSDEARMRGVDPGAYGNTIVDPASLSGEDKEWYDAWAEAHPGESMYSGLLEQLGWRQDLYSVDVYRGMNDGTITVENGVITVTPEAIERYGEDNLLFFHRNRNGPAQLIRVPEGSNLWIQEQQVFEGETPEGWTDDQWTQWMAEQNSGGYTLVNTRPERKHGIVSEFHDAVDHVFGDTVADIATIAVGAGLGVLTGNPVIAGLGLAASSAPALDSLGLDEAYFVTDPLGVTSGLMYGTEGMERNLEGAQSVLGDDAGMYQGIGRAVAGTALGLIPGFGPLASTAFSAMSSFNQAAAGYQSMQDAFIQTGISALSSSLMQVAPPGQQLSIGDHFINAVNSGMSSALQTGLTGERDWDAALQAGATSGLSSFASSNFNALVRPRGAVLGAAVGGTVGAGTGYLTSEMMGASDDQRDRAVASGFATGALSGGAAGAAREGQTSRPGFFENAVDYYTDWAPNGQPRGWDEAVQAWDFVTPWDTHNERRQIQELRERFNIRGYREPSSFSIPDDWARDPFEGIGYVPQGNFRLGA